MTGLRVVVHPVPELPGGGWGSGPVDPRRARRARPAPAGKPGTVPRRTGLDDDSDRKGTFMLTAVAVTADAIAGDQVNLYKMQKIARVTASSWDPAASPRRLPRPAERRRVGADLGASGPVHLTATFAEPIRTDVTPFLTAQLNFGFGKSLVPGLFELFAVTGNDDGTDLPPAIVAALETGDGQRPPEERAQLWQYCAAHVPELEPRRVALANLEERLAVLTEAFPDLGDERRGEAWRYLCPQSRRLFRSPRRRSARAPPRPSRQYRRGRRATGSASGSGSPCGTIRSPHASR